MCLWNKLVLTLSIKAYSQVHYGKYSNEMRRMSQIITTVSFNYFNIKDVKSQGK